MISILDGVSLGGLVLSALFRNFPDLGSYDAFKVAGSAADTGILISCTS